MQTKSSKEKFWDNQLEYLNKRPLLSKGTSILDMEWMEKMFDDSHQGDPYMLAIHDKHNLPNKESVLLLFHFFRNCHKPRSNSHIADMVLAEIKKYWAHSNIPIQHDWWAKKSILTLNSKYLDLMKL